MIVNPIVEDEVFERLRTQLASQGLLLHRGSLDGAAHDDLGRFYVTGPDGLLQDAHVDLERWARRYGALQANEAIVPSHGEASA